MISHITYAINLNVLGAIIADGAGVGSKLKDSGQVDDLAAFAVGEFEEEEGHADVFLEETPTKTRHQVQYTDV